MTIEDSHHSVGAPADTIHASRTIASYERELAAHRRTEARLREALSREAALLRQEEALLRQKDELIQQRELLSSESNHRLLNNLQMIVSLLSLQSRASANAEVAAQLATAANRVATIERIHRRLHFLDGMQVVAFKHYLEDLCGDLSTLLGSQERPDQVIAVEGIEINLPTATAIPLGFIVNELLTNAVKYGNGPITVTLAPAPEKGYALSVANEGSVLPEGFDPAGSKGLGMRIIGSFVARIGGELRIGRCDDNQGTRFTVLFS